MALTAKQERFVEEYLIDLNATQAATRAGYSEKTAGKQGTQLLAKTGIAAAIAKAQARRSKRTDITQDRVLRELARIGFADIRKAVAWTSTGVVLNPSDEVDDETAAAIVEVSEGRDGLKLKLADKLGALEKIGRHLGMFGADKGEEGDAPGLNINITSNAPVRDVRVTRSQG